MIGKGTKLYSILGLKCPRCHEGDLFPNKNPYKLDKFFEMHTECPHCGLKYEREPGFYYGAMYVSYGVAVAWMVTVFVAMYVIADWISAEFNLEWYLITSIGSLVAIAPVMFKVSRSIWINMFVHYDPKYKESKTSASPSADTAG